MAELKETRMGATDTSHSHPIGNWISSRKACALEVSDSMVYLKFGQQHGVLVIRMPREFLVMTTATDAATVSESSELLGLLTALIKAATGIPGASAILQTFFAHDSEPIVDGAAMVEDEEFDIWARVIDRATEIGRDSPTTSAWEAGCAALTEVGSNGELENVLETMLISEPPARRTIAHLIDTSGLVVRPAAWGADLDDERHLDQALLLAKMFLERYVELDRLVSDTIIGSIDDRLEETNPRTLAAELADEWPTATPTQIGDLVASRLEGEDREILNGGKTDDCWLTADTLAQAVIYERRGY